MAWTMTPGSSQISGYDYCEKSSCLTIEFNGGSRYEYYGVPETVVSGIKTSKSVGKFFHANVKNKFKYSKL